MTGRNGLPRKMPQEVVDEIRRQVRIRRGLIPFYKLAARAGVSVRAVYIEARKWRRQPTMDLIPDSSVQDFCARLGITREWKEYKWSHGLAPYPAGPAQGGEHALDVYTAEIREVE